MTAAVAPAEVLVEVVVTAAGVPAEVMATTEVLVEVLATATEVLAEVVAKTVEVAGPHLLMAALSVATSYIMVWATNALYGKMLAYSN